MTQLELHAKTRSDQIAIITFLEWLEESGMEVTMKDGGMVCDQPEQLAQRSLGIDRRQLDKERRATLAGLNVLALPASPGGAQQRSEGLSNED